MPIRQQTIMERWLATSNYATTTETSYREILTRFQRRFPIMAESVRHEHLVEFLTTDEDGHKTSRAPRTLATQRTVLTVFWRYASESGYVKRNPAEGLDRLVLGRGDRREGRWLTRSELVQFLESFDQSDQGQRDRTLVLVALLTGLRRAELKTLTWRQVDLSQARISVKGKGSKLATIGIPHQALMALKSWSATAAARQSKTAPSPNQPVFPTGRKVGGLNDSMDDYRFLWNVELTAGALGQIVHRRAKEAGLGHVGTHDLRRSFAGLLDEDGIDLKGIQAALRHSSPDVTARCYLDRSPRRAVEATANLSI